MSLVLPLVGLSAFWTYLRYSSFFGIFVPLSMQGGLFGGVLSPLILELVVLAAFLAVCLLSHDRLQSLLDNRRGFVSFLCALGSFGAFGAVAFPQSDVAVVCAICLASASFISALLMWASWSSSRLNPTSVLVMFVSYFLSVVLFSRYGLVGQVLTQELVAVLVPLVTSACWYALNKIDGDRKVVRPDYIAGGIFRGLFNPLVCMLAVFLLIGSVIRGIVDMAFPDPHTRMLLSIPVYGFAIVPAGVLYYRGVREAPKVEEGRLCRLPRRNGSGATLDIDNTRFVIWYWIGLSALFFAGLICFMLTEHKGIAGGVVVMARSLLDLVLWLLLCDMAHRKGVPFVPLFLVYGLFFHTVSWALSYAVVPSLAGNALGFEAVDGGMYIAAFSFGIVALFVLLTGCMVAFSDKALTMVSVWSADASWLTDNPIDGGAQIGGAKASPTELRERCIEKLVEDGGLTEREAAVIVLYAQGYSFGKVAEDLGITKSTVQSHLRNSYRKLAIHSKDELIEYVRMLVSGLS